MTLRRLYSLGVLLLPVMAAHAQESEVAGLRSSLMRGMCTSVVSYMVRTPFVGRAVRFADAPRCATDGPAERPTALMRLQVPVGGTMRLRVPGGTELRLVSDRWVRHGVDSLDVALDPGAYDLVLTPAPGADLAPRYLSVMSDRGCWTGGATALPVGTRTDSLTTRSCQGGLGGAGLMYRITDDTLSDAEATETLRLSGATGLSVTALRPDGSIVPLSANEDGVSAPIAIPPRSGARYLLLSGTPGALGIVTVTRTPILPPALAATTTARPAAAPRIDTRAERLGPGLDRAPGLTGQTRGIPLLPDAPLPDSAGPPRPVGSVLDPVGSTGLLLRRVDNELLVHGARPNSPASELGLGLGDVLLAVNGLSVRGSTPEAVLPLLDGPPGSVVRLRVMPASGTEASAMDVRLTRRLLPPVPAQSMADLKAVWRGAQFYANDTPELGPPRHAPHYSTTFDRLGLKFVMTHVLVTLPEGDDMRRLTVTCSVTDPAGHVSTPESGIVAVRPGSDRVTINLMPFGSESGDRWMPGAYTTLCQSGGAPVGSAAYTVR